MSYASHEFGFVRIASSFANSFGGTWLIHSRAAASPVWRRRASAL